MRFLAVLALALAASPDDAPATPPSAAPGEVALTGGARPLPPLPPPIVTFRQLLAMNSQDRERELEQMPEERRRLLAAKLQEYETLSPERREARLRATQLCAWLIPLMTAAPAERASELAGVPAPERGLVEQRLAFWDALPADLQRDLLAHGPFLGYFARLEAGAPARPAAGLQSLPPAERQRVEDALAQWQRIAPARRQELEEHFRRLFSAPPNEQERLLEVLPSADRPRLEAALKALGQLPAEQRQLSVESLHKFLRLQPEEREQFLRNAERWRQMTPEQRQAWRRLATKLPPLPPPFPPRHKPVAGTGPNAIATTTGAGN